MTQALGPAQIEIAVFEPGVLVGVGFVFNDERRHGRRIEQTQLVANQFHFAGGVIGIDRFRRPFR